MPKKRWTAVEVILNYFKTAFEQVQLRLQLKRTLKQRFCEPHKQRIWWGHTSANPIKMSPWPREEKSSLEAGVMIQQDDTQVAVVAELQAFFQEIQAPAELLSLLLKCPTCGTHEPHTRMRANRPWLVVCWKCTRIRLVAPTDLPPG